MKVTDSFSRKYTYNVKGFMDALKSIDGCTKSALEK